MNISIKDDPNIPKKWTKLTRREWEVVELVADGHGKESISNQLDIKISTVGRHLNNIFKKLGINSSLELACEFYKSFLKLVTNEQTISTPNKA